MKRLALLLALAAPALSSAAPAPIACQLNALNMREQGRHETLQKALMPTAHIEERPDGYAFRWKGDAATYSKLVEFVGYERRCCPFLHFEVQAAATSEPLWLVVSGTPEVKAFLAESGFFFRKLGEK